VKSSKPVVLASAAGFTQFKHLLPANLTQAVVAAIRMAVTEPSHSALLAEQTLKSISCLPPKSKTHA